MLTGCAGKSCSATAAKGRHRTLELKPARSATAFAIVLPARKRFAAVKRTWQCGQSQGGATKEGAHTGEVGGRQNVSRAWLAPSSCELETERG